jgi:5'-3' exonuclease
LQQFTFEENLRGAAGIGLGTAIKYLRQTTSAAEGNGLSTTISYLHGAASIGLGTRIKYLRRATSVAAGTSLGTTINCLRRKTISTAGNGLDNTIKYL